MLYLRLFCGIGSRWESLSLSLSLRVCFFYSHEQFVLPSYFLAQQFHLIIIALAYMPAL